MPIGKDELESLPEEVRAQIKGEGMRDNILAVVRDNGGRATIDDIMLLMYRNYGLIEKRSYILVTLSRMCNKTKTLERVRRGCYRLPGSVSERRMQVRFKSEDYRALPRELRNQINVQRVTVDHIIDAIEFNGGTATLNDIMVDLYRRYGTIGRREIIQQHIYILCKANVLLSNGRGIYRVGSG